MFMRVNSRCAHQVRPPPSRLPGLCFLWMRACGVGVVDQRSTVCVQHRFWQLCRSRREAGIPSAVPDCARGFKSGPCNQRYLQLWSGAA